MESFVTLSIFTLSSMFRFPPVLVFSKFIEWINLQVQEDVKIHLEEIFASKDSKWIFWEENNGSDPKMAESTRMKRHLYHWFVFKNYLIFAYKNRLLGQHSRYHFLTTRTDDGENKQAILYGNLGRKEGSSEKMIVDNNGT